MFLFKASQKALKNMLKWIYPTKVWNPFFLYYASDQGIYFLWLFVLHSFCEGEREIRHDEEKFATAKTIWKFSYFSTAFMHHLAHIFFLLVLSSRNIKNVKIDFRITVFLLSFFMKKVSFTSSFTTSLFFTFLLFYETMYSLSLWMLTYTPHITMLQFIARDAMREKETLLPSHLARSNSIIWIIS